MRFTSQEQWLQCASRQPEGGGMIKSLASCGGSRCWTVVQVLGKNSMRCGSPRFFEQRAAPA